MARMVQYQKFGGPEVLQVVDLPDPTPGAGEVRLRVRSVGLNPVDYKTFSGDKRLRLVETVQKLIHPARWFGGEPSFPRGVGRDFAGIIDTVGPGVTGLAVGDEVLGTLRSAPGDGDRRGSLTELLVAPASDIAPKPAGLSWDVAGSLGVAAQTVAGALRHLRLTSEDVIVIAGASGGVGSLATQVALHQGAAVIGIASARNSDYLRALGAIPVAYGDGIEDRITQAHPAPATKLLDCHLGEYTRLGFALGLSGSAIGSLAPNPAAMLRGAQFTGSRHAEPDDLPRIAALIAEGAGDVRLEETYPFTIDEVRKAYARLAEGHVRGKLVITLT